MAVDLLSQQVYFRLSRLAFLGFFFKPRLKELLLLKRLLRFQEELAFEPVDARKELFSFDVFLKRRGARLCSLLLTLLLGAAKLFLEIHALFLPGVIQRRLEFLESRIVLLA